MQKIGWSVLFYVLLTLRLLAACVLGAAVLFVDIVDFYLRVMEPALPYRFFEYNPATNSRIPEDDPIEDDVHYITEPQKCCAASDDATDPLVGFGAYIPNEQLST